MSVYSRQATVMAEVVPRTTLAGRVHDRLAEAIVRGEIAPGSAVNEVELAARLGVSRAPLREAILRLEGRGLVHRVPHLGARVVVMTPKDLAELYAIREGLEGVAARLAATAMSDADLRALAESLAEHGQQPDLASGTAYYQAGGDRDFHFRIARGSGSERLFRLLCEDMYLLLRIYRFRGSGAPGRARQAFAEHLEILEALERRDPGAAEAAMRRHIRQSWLNAEARIAGGAEKEELAGS